MSLKSRTLSKGSRRSISGAGTGLTRTAEIARWLAIGGLVLVLAGCATQRRPTGRPPRSRAAEPGRGPIVTETPAGRSVIVGIQPQGIVVDARAGLVAVAVRNPSAIVLLSIRTLAVVRRIPIAGAPRHLALVGAGGPLLVPEESVDRVLELTLPGGRAPF